MLSLYKTSLPFIPTVAWCIAWFSYKQAKSLSCLKHFWPTKKCVVCTSWPSDTCGHDVGRSASPCALLPFRQETPSPSRHKTGTLLLLPWWCTVHINILDCKGTFQSNLLTHLCSNHTEYWLSLAEAAVSLCATTVSSSASRWFCTHRLHLLLKAVNVHKNTV